MVFLRMQLPAAECHQILFQVNVVVVIAVMFDEQRALLRKTFRQKRYQRFRHQTHLQLLSVPREDLFRREQGFSEFRSVVSPGIGQRERHEILLVLFRIPLRKCADA